MEKEGRTRLLLVLRILRERTDEGHTLSTAELERILREEYGIDAYRITIQKDIAALNEAGYSIETIRSSQNKYYYTGRPFELPELKLLVDAVESSKFITERKSKTLAEKLTSLASRHQASALKRNIHIADRIKAKNEQIYYIMDAINDAINVEIVDQDHFRLRTEVAASPTFFAWVFEFGGAIRIEGPQQVREAYQDLIDRAKESLNEP